MSRFRIAFLGTSEFAVTCLKSLLSDEHFEIVGVVTQPDRPSGRGLKLTPSPIKVLALAEKLDVISPEKVSEISILKDLTSWGAEAAVVVAYGQILSEDFLKIFPLGAVNVHGSLLPKWRGAAPIQRSIEAGDPLTGVALQKIVKALDAGDVIGVRTTAIDPNETALQLHDRLAVLGAELLHVEFMDYLRGQLVPQAQDHSQKTYAKKILKEECQLHWEQTALQLHNRVRAFTMGPGTWCLFQGKKLKILSTKFHGQEAKLAPGCISKITKDSLWIACGEGCIELLEVQPESRSRMKIEDFIKSYNLFNALKIGDSVV